MALDLDVADLAGLRYRCLEGCGFCCTFTPEVSSEELARLRTRFPRLPVVASEDDETRRHIAFKGGCGACTLLERRACSAYDLRPAHCRHFPFHVHYGRTASALVNRSCRGVEADPAGDLKATFQADVLAHVKEHDLAGAAEDAQAVFRQWDENCKAAGVSGDAVAEARAVLAGDLSWPGLRRLASGIGVPFDELWASILEPLAFEDVVSRPFYLAADLRWFTFDGKDGRLSVLEMDESGSLKAVKALKPPKVDSGLSAEQLRRVVGFFVARAPFEGQVAWLVDDTDYQLPVAEAARLRVLELCLEAQWRAQVLWQLGVPEDQMEAEAERFLDGAFLDAPTIAGWL